MISLMKFRILLLSICLSFFSIVPLLADVTTFHVSPNGSDRFPGTQAKPWKTLEYAFSKLQDVEEDVRLVVMDGEYYPLSTLRLEGIKGRSIFIEAAAGSSPTIRGDRRILKFRTQGKFLVADLKSFGVTGFGEACDKDNLLDLYWEGTRQSIASYPEQGFIISADAMGETVVDKVTRKEGVFSYADDRVSSWAGEQDAWIYGYFRWDWRDEYQKIHSMDSVKKVITLEEPWHHYGYKSGFKFRGVNLFCELDSPGEYYVDRERGRLYWMPPEGYKKGDEVSLSVFNAGNMMEVFDCENVTVKGLTFVGGRTNAMAVEKSRNVLLEGIGAFRFGCDALHVCSSEDVRIEGCRFGTLGHTGMKLSGGDRSTLRPSGYVVHNTIVKDISLFRHTYEPALFFSGCGLNVSHCEFSGSSSSAMRIEGNDVVVEYCHFHDLVQESDDQGAIDIFYNYGYRGNVIRYNLWENIRGGSLHGSAGVRFDDMISGQKVYGNIFRNVGGGHFGGVQIHGGKDNVVEDNLFYNCNIGVSFSPWGQAHWDEALTREEVVKRLYEEVDIDSPLYRERYPELAGDIHSNVDRNIIRNNLMVGCRRMFYDEKGQNCIINNSALSTGEDAELSKPLEHYLSPEILASFGLKPIPYKEIGPEGSRLF